MSDRLVDERPLAREWAPLGVQVKPVSMAGHGSCSPMGRTRTIYVNRKDHHELQRFTVAHELGHLLLMDAESRRRLHPKAQEKLCDSFASALLIPRNRLSAALQETGLPPSPADLIRLCGRFRVNVRPMFFAIGELLEDGSDFLVFARYRGHRLRPEELAFHVEATTGARHAYFPPEQRLASLGLSNLVVASENAAHGDSIAGADSAVILGLRGLDANNTSDSVKGPVVWRAFRAGKEAPYVLAIIDLAEILRRTGSS